MRKNNRRPRDPLEPERLRVQTEWDRNHSARREEIALRVPAGGIGAEIGVDTGQLTRRFMELNHFHKFYAVDRWNDRAHSEYQFQAVAEKLKIFDRCKVYRMTALDFAEIVPDNYFDFIYIDCYAHTGQDDGAVLAAMWPKLKPGGLFSGDDYDPKKWPKTVAEVNAFANQHDYEISIHSPVLRNTAGKMDQADAWYFYKQGEDSGKA
jgi:SAM-dependent methyltransferase